MIKILLLGLLLFLTGSAHAISQTNTGNKVLVGDRTVTDKTLEFNIGSGATNPKLKINSSTTKLQFSNDGTNFTDLGGLVSSSTDIQNVGISATVSGNALTVSLKQSDGSTNCSVSSACSISFRSSTTTSGGFSKLNVTGALSVTVSSGSTLGTVSAVQSTVYVYAINNSGTIELAVSTGLYENSEIISTTAEGGSGAADSIRTIYSTTARTNVPISLIGKVISTQATAGTWATNPSSVAVQPFKNEFRIEHVLINSGCTTIGQSSSSWVGSVSSGGTGQCNINFATGYFSQIPLCFVMGVATGVNTGELAVAYVTLATSNFQFYMSQPGVGAQNRQAQVFCIGYR